MYNKQHLITLLGYIGIGFIGGSVSHGVFSGTRSLVTAAIGILLFLLSEYLKGGEKNYGELIIGGLIFSIAIGMVSGGFQHFLDSPMRSLWIIPLGWFVSTLIYPYKEGLTNYQRGKSLLVGAIISAGLVGFLWSAIHFLPQGIFEGGDHHGATPTMDHSNMNKNPANPHANMDHGSMATDEISFLVNMIPHHQEAVDTSRIILEKSSNTDLKVLAQQIIDAQVKEIAMMQGWISSWYPNNTLKASYTSMMNPNLATMTDHELDDSYMTDMIVHHQGAVDMANVILKIETKPELASFARDIISVQAGEIAQLKQLLDASKKAINKSHH